MRKILYATSAFAVGLAFASTVQAQIVTNGSFATGLSGWTVTGAVASGNAGGQFTPNTLADFGAGSTTGGSLYQTIVTVPGTNYILSFLYGGFGTGGTQSLQYSIFTGTPPVMFHTINAVPDTDYAGGFVYSSYSAAFTATDTSVIIGFVDTTATANAAGADGVLTSVKVAAIPEPVSMAILGVGLLGLGAVRFRRSV